MFGYSIPYERVFVRGAIEVIIIFQNIIVDYLLISVYKFDVHYI